MNKYEIRTNKKKEAIINTSYELFRKNGFTNTSIKEIAALSNVSQVSIYNYFGSKDALVFECVKLLSHDVIAKGREILNSDIDYKERLLTGITLLSGSITLSMQDYFSASSLSDDNFVHLLNVYIRELEQEIIAEYIEVGKKEGVIHPSIPTETILKFIGAVHSIELSAEDAVQEIKDFHKLYLYGLIGK